MGGIPVQARGDNTIFFNLAAPLMTAFLTALRPLRQTFLHEIRYLTVWVGQANHAQTPIYWCICNPYLWYRCSCAYICIKQSFINHHSISPPSRMMNHPRVRREMCLVHPGTGATALSSALRPTILNFWLQIWVCCGWNKKNYAIYKNGDLYPFRKIDMISFWESKGAMEDWSKNENLSILVHELPWSSHLTPKNTFSFENVDMGQNPVPHATHIKTTEILMRIIQNVPIFHNGYFITWPMPISRVFLVICPHYSWLVLSRDLFLIS